MTRAMDMVRHAAERGKILATLAEDYGRGSTSIHNLIGALDLLGVSLTDDGLAFHLTYLADGGYIQTTRARDLPSWRTDRRCECNGDAIVLVKLLPLGLQLIDGNAPEDPQVRF